MLNEDKIETLLAIETLHYEEIFSVNCALNQMVIPARSMTLMLSESQKRLLLCLVHKIACKRDIIKVVWKDTHQRIRDNNYHQLVFQIRALFQRHGLPDNLIITVPYFGLRMNEPLFREWVQQDVNALPEDSPVGIDAQGENPQEEKKKKLIQQLLAMTRGLF